MAAGRARKSATRAVEWLVAILGGLVFSAILVWLLRGPSTPEAPPPPVQAPAPASIIAAPQTPSPAPEAPPPTLEKLKLRGIMARPGQTAAAIIETADGRQRLYHVGSTILPGVTVERIDPTTVIIQTGSQHQSIRFGDAPPAAVQTGPGTPESFDERQGTSADLATSSNDYRISMKANRFGNETRGFAIKDPARMPIFRRAGLQPGDIVKSVNGITLISEEKIIDLPDELAGSREVRIVFERNGTPQAVTVRIAR
jgi:general secretion pathway protein C